MPRKAASSIEVAAPKEDVSFDIVGSVRGEEFAGGFIVGLIFSGWPLSSSCFSPHFFFCLYFLLSTSFADIF